MFLVFPFSLLWNLKIIQMEPKKVKSSNSKRWFSEVYLQPFLVFVAKLTPKAPNSHMASLEPCLLSQYLSLPKTNSSHLSHEKSPGWLGYIGDYTTQLYRDYGKNYKEPTSIMESRRVFFVAHLNIYGWQMTFSFWDGISSGANC